MQESNLQHITKNQYSKIESTMILFIAMALYELQPETWLYEEGIQSNRILARCGEEQFRECTNRTSH